MSNLMRSLNAFYGGSKKLLSLFDYSGIWSLPYALNGWETVRVDIKLGIDIMTWDYREYDRFDGILAAPPCTDFARAGCKHWAAKDADGRTDKSIAIVRKTLEIIRYFEPGFWALENPGGRINKLVPELGEPAWKMNPSDYGENYTKLTYLWGKFSPPMALNGKAAGGIPVPAMKNRIMQLGGASEKTKTLRSLTPPGFSVAFYEANH